MSPASPYVELDRQAWARLAAGVPLPLTTADVDRLRGLGDPVDLAEVAEVYLPLARLVELHVAAAEQLRRETARLLGTASAIPYVIGIAGSVAAGKSTTARVLRELLACGPGSPRVGLVATDGFLLPNAELARRGLLPRKGFPESYDQRRLLRFLAEVKAGVPEVRAPVYSHLSYDLVPGEELVVRRPDVLLVEGLNVLQTPRLPTPDVVVSDFFDFSIYVDARIEDLRRWYVERFLALRRTAFRDPASYFSRYAALGEDEAVAEARRLWRDINEVNLRENVLPTRGRARLVLEKGPDHAVRSVRLRRP